MAADLAVGDGTGPNPERACETPRLSASSTTCRFRRFAASARLFTFANFDLKMDVAAQRCVLSFDDVPPHVARCVDGFGRALPRPFDRTSKSDQDSRVPQGKWQLTGSRRRLRAYCDLLMKDTRFSRSGTRWRFGRRRLWGRGRRAVTSIAFTRESAYSKIVSRAHWHRRKGICVHDNRGRPKHARNGVEVLSRWTS